MFLTTDILIKRASCIEGVEFLDKHFPNGAELIDIINYRFTPTEFLHWGYLHLNPNKEEIEAYWNRLKVDTSARSSIYESDNIAGGSYISCSSHITNSDYIFSSKEVKDSNSILSSSYIEHSKQIVNSEFCYNSNKVFLGSNINDSYNIIQSNYVVNSQHVINSNSIVDCFCIGDWMSTTSRITDGAFIVNCQQLEHCLFCSQLENKEYHLFNQPIPPGQFDLIKKQMASILRDWEPQYMIKDWSANIIPIEPPRILRNPLKQYADLPEAFWRWVITLPNYNPNILYSITFNKDLL